MNLKHTILNYYKEIELTDIPYSIVNLVIEDKCDVLGDMKIIGYEHLESIHVRENSLKNIRSLVIMNNSVLKSIVFESHSCYYTVRFELSSSIVRLIA